MSTIVGILYLNIPSYKLEWGKWVVILLHAVSVVVSTLVFVMRAPLVISSVVRFRISYEIVTRIIKEMVMGQ